jgi:hypothetical protein
MVTFFFHGPAGIKFLYCLDFDSNNGLQLPDSIPDGAESRKTIKTSFQGIRICGVGHDDRFVIDLSPASAYCIHQR